jgi:hypothetical protein
MPSVLFSSAELFSLYKKVDLSKESLLREILAAAGMGGLRFMHI